MPDIVERLRDRSLCQDDTGIWLYAKEAIPLMREAADEIETLRAKAERFGVAYENEVVVTRDLRAKIYQLVAELNKYELAALQARTAQRTRND